MVVVLEKVEAVLGEIYTAKCSDARFAEDW